MAENIVKTSSITQQYGFIRKQTSEGVSSTTNSRFTSTYVNSFNGTKNSHWKEDIKNLRNATTPANGSRTSVKSTLAFGSKKYWSWTWNGYYNSMTVESYLWPGRLAQLGSTEQSTSTITADNLAKSRLQAALIGFESSASGGEDLGEISQTAKMLRSPMKDLRDLTVRHLDRLERAFNRPSAREIAKGLASSALEYRFGVEPLTKTIGDGLVGLQNRDYLAYYYPFNVSGKDEKVSNASQGLDSSSTVNIGFYVTGFTKSVTRVRYKGIWAVQADLDKRAVSDVLRLRWRDVIPTVWNLIPNSFLLDYVTNIGDIAESIAVPWSGVKWCCRTQRYVVTKQISTVGLAMLNSPPSPNQDIQTGYVPGSTTEETVTFTREAQVLQPRPVFEIDLNLSGRQLQNVGLLMASKIPLLSGLAKKRSSQHPDLADSIRHEFGQRGHRIPYPFHNT